jgi:hypothetical protein
MAETRQELKFEVQSLNRSKKTIDYVKEAEALSSEVEKAVSEQYPGTAVTIRRDEGLPIAPLIQHLIVSIDWHAVKMGAEQAAAAFATTQILTVLKQKVQDLFAKPIDSGNANAEQPRASGQKVNRPAKKSLQSASKKAVGKNPKGKGRS